MIKHPLDHLIETRIQEAIDNGDLSDLHNAGKPLEDLLQTTDDILARIIAEQGGKPHYVLLNGKLQALIKRLDQVKDPLRRKALENQIADMRTRMAIEKERNR
ncbi:DnaJ family domain-containing protein [uncultured Cohaesibacter sp.]|uniref:DnaJ family domain-containing protein n=1 Tax=uncultured Cohaesibacter sp. TaxID=1002546 RepID=UPI00292F6ECB|nr:DnaJ family domain-containing protein [uncultured Cohaesibacter sp.]